MKKIFFLVLLLPAMVSAQFKSVSFNADNFPLKLSRQSASQDLNALLAIPGQFSFQLKTENAKINDRGETSLTYQQYYGEYPIEHAIIKLHYREGKLYYINGLYLSAVSGNSFSPQLTESQAFERAKQDCGAEEYIWDSKGFLDGLPKNSSTELLFPEPHAQLVVFSVKTETGNSTCLAYKFDIYAAKPVSRHYVYVDASTGAIAGKENRIRNVNGTADTRYSGQRVIAADAFSGHFRLRDYDSNRGDGIETYNMQGGSVYTSAIDFTDNDNDWSTAEFANVDKDNAALDAHWGAMMTYDYFLNVHGRNSINDNGEALIGYVHSTVTSSDNAAWNGTAMVYADGGGDMDAVTSLDVVAHEIGHGLCERTAALTSLGEAAALDESLSDIWGACVEHYATTGKQTWVNAEDITTVSPYYLRSFINPNAGLDAQPDTYGGTYWEPGYQADPHVNSGVMNHWFYLLSEGGSGTNDHSNAFDVTGIGMDDAASIVFRAETMHLQYNSEYADARRFTILAAQQIFGNCSQQVLSTIAAWYAVGVGSSLESIDEKHIVVDVSPSTMEDVYAITLLEASNVIGASSNIRYQSSGQVVLSPEFSTDGATNFTAEILPCIDLQNAKKDNLKDNTTSIGSSKSVKIESDLSVKLFPNPASDLLSILFRTDKVENAHVNITDANGKTVKSCQINSKLGEVQISDLAAGFYFVHILFDGKVFSSKIIKN